MLDEIIPIKPAPRIVAFLLRLFGYKAITMPWRRVYMLPEAMGDKKLVRHEGAHLMQIERDGAIMFSLRYLWWNIRYGYINNPYEIEARKIENAV